MMRNILCLLGFHAWYYIDNKPARKAIRGWDDPISHNPPNRRICMNLDCQAHQRLDKECIGINPPEYVTKWRNV